MSTKIVRFGREYKRRWQQIGGAEGIVRRYFKGTLTLDIRRMANRKKLTGVNTHYFNGELYEYTGKANKNRRRAI